MKTRTFKGGLLLALLVACIVPACGGGGGGGGGGGPVDPPTPARMISWTGDAAPGSETVFLEIRDLSNPDTFVLQIRVNEVTNFYGLALDVVYPSDRMTFRGNSVEEGNFLNGGGNIDTRLEVDERNAGRIVIGYTRVGDQNGRTGSGQLLALTFDTTANGTSDLAIDNEFASDSDGFEIDATWLGGTVQVQR